MNGWVRRRCGLSSDMLVFETPSHALLRASTFVLLRLHVPQRWPEEDREERIAYQALNGIRNPDGSAVPSVPLHVVREGSSPDATFVEGFYSSDARSWLVRSGNEPAGPSAGARLRRWEAMGIVHRIEQVSVMESLSKAKHARTSGTSIVAVESQHGWMTLNVDARIRFDRREILDDGES